MDRRFGENDPAMTPEERALERFVREKQRGSKKGALFDLEDAEDNNLLTHFGESLSFDGPYHLDDFKEDCVEKSKTDVEGLEGEVRPAKRRKVLEVTSINQENSGGIDGAQVERTRTKKEVMTEVIAKSRLHKYERQKAKEDDDDLRAELDKGLLDVFALLRGNSHAPQQLDKLENRAPHMNPDRAALLNNENQSQGDKTYDERLRQMALDQRSKPTERTMTEEERLEIEAQKLRELEKSRLKRMQGEYSDSDEAVQGTMHVDDQDLVEHDNFGLGSGIPEQNEARQLGFEDEDDFVIEDDLVAHSSDADVSESGSAEGLGDDICVEDDDDREFTQGLLSKADFNRDGFDATGAQKENPVSDNTDVLAFTYECPQSHQEFLEITEKVQSEDLPTVVQRIRALYHPKLHNDNKAKLGAFSQVLINHVSYMANQPSRPPFAVLETLIRHVHSLARMFPKDVGSAVRMHLKEIHEIRPTALNPGDLVVLTAIASIFPTSDHFHPVVTPAALSMARYLSQKLPQSLGEIATGTYVESLCLQYQRLSKRYVPEAMNYTLQVLLALAPMKADHIPGFFPLRASSPSLRIAGGISKTEPVNRRLKFWDIVPSKDTSEVHNEVLKVALLDTHITLVSTMADLWAEKPAFCEAFDPVSKVLQHLLNKACSSKLSSATKVST